MGRPFKIRAPGEMRCPFCGRQFPYKYKAHLNQHIRSHIKERSCLCHICGKGFLDDFTLFRHSFSHQTEVWFKCDVCFKQFKTKYALNEHKKNLHSKLAKKKFECDTCGKLLSSKRHLKRHNDNVHLNIRPAECSICLRKYQAETVLTQHMVCHTGEKPFTCDLCPKRFGLSSNFKRHMKTIHFKPSEDKRTCAICKKIFSTMENLKCHLKRHNEKRSIKCQLCPRDFYSTSELTTHMVRHTNEKYYKCNKCNEEFTAAASIAAHDKRNNCWQQSFVCVFCNKDFRNHNQPAKRYQDHIWRHIEEKPYICLCQAEFNYCNFLQHHLKQCRA